MVSLQSKAVYIHIPFCNHICSYCDFAKMYYNKKWVNSYLDSLEYEINSNYNNEIINTIYIGGGTPTSLDLNELRKLFNIIKLFKKNKNIEYTIEANIENITEDKIKLCKEYGINRISIGIQTLNDKYIKYLNRYHEKEEVFNKIHMIKKYIDNINIDLIYGINNQTLEELEEDIDYVLKLDVKHISTYSLIIEPHTKLYIDNVSNIDEDIDFDMYNLICNKFKKYGYIHYEISNFSKEGYESKHNLTYWNNLEYYGFGLGASGYINGIRYDNTKSLNEYLNHNYIINSHKLNDKEKIEEEFILGLRKINGINKKDFFHKYNMDIYNVSNVKDLIQNNKLIDNKEHIYINPEYIYTSNDILVEFID